MYNYSSFISHCCSCSEDIHSFIGKLDNTSAAGVDGITSLMLKGTAYTVNPILFETDWDLYVDHICEKVYKTIGFILRSFHSAPINTRRTLYLPLVRSILEYASTTWHPLNIKLTDRIDSMQRFACRVILHQWKLSHNELLQESDLPTLAKRPDVATLCHLFKIFHGLCSSPNPY